MTDAEILAMPAGQELDALVGVHVMGWPRIGPNDPYRWYMDRGGVVVEGFGPQRFNIPGGEIPVDFHPSTNTADAWLALAKCYHEWEIGCDPAGWGDVKIHGWRGTPDDGDDVEHKASFEHISKAPAAICKALLLDALTRGGGGTLLATVK